MVNDACPANLGGDKEEEEEEEEEDSGSLPPPPTESVSIFYSHIYLYI